MSEQTRMSKYKDLRDNIDDDTYVPHEEDDADVCRLCVACGL